MRHKRPPQLRPQRAHPLRERAVRLRGRLPDSRRRRDHQRHDLVAAVHRGEVHGAQGIPPPRIQVGGVGHEGGAFGVQPGQPPRY